MKNFKAIFFDNDGVLLDTEILYFIATQNVLREIGIELSEQDYRRLFVQVARGMWKLLLPLGHPDDFIWEMRKRRKDEFSRLLETADIVIDGVPEVVEMLSKRFFIGLVTSGYRQHVEVEHQKSGLLEYFSLIIANDDYKNAKPDPEPYFIALERSGFAAGECLVIEDSERGLLAAKAAGIDCWVIPSELTGQTDLSKADKLLESIRELPELLLYNQ